MTIKNTLKKSNIRGATIVEYALIVAVMVVAGVAIFTKLKTSADTAATNAANALTNAK